MKFLEITYYNNTIQNWMIAVLIAVVTIVILKILKTFLSKKLAVFVKKTKTRWDDLIHDLFQKTKFFFLLFLGIYAGSLVLSLTPTLGKFIQSAVIIVFLIQAAIWGSAVISFVTKEYMREKMEEDAAGVTTVTALGFVGKLILFTVILLLALENMGVDITALVAGLGIGGIAIALALQNILGDLFASLSIVLDKPFVIGDFIIINEYMGTIEHIGLKTTRIRSLSGEQLVFSNNDLLRSRIRNYKRMYERRIVFSIGVIYQTSYEQLKIIPSIIREIIESQENARFDRAHFKEFGDFSLNFEIVYWIKLPDYNIYMDTQQEINLSLYQKFEEEAIEFAYPSQTIFVENSGNDENIKNKTAN